MFKRILLLAIGTVWWTGGSVSDAQAVPPGPQGFAQDTPSADPCIMEIKAAVSAIKLRDAGRPKQDLASALPSRDDKGNYLATAMYSILDDVYDNPSVQSFPYYTYRLLTCHARFQGRPVPKDFSIVASAVLACQKQFGINPSDSLINCIRTATFQHKAG